MQPKQVDQQGQPPDQRPVTQKIQQNTQAVVEEAQKEVADARVPWYRTIKRGQLLLGLYAVQLALFALLAFWVHFHPVLAIDVAITREFQENNAPWLKFTMIVVSYIGNVFWLSTGLVLLAAIILWMVHLRLEALILIGLNASSALLNGILKLIVERPRPTANLVEIIQATAGQSFPSGHVMAYMAFWGYLFSLGVILFKGNRWWRIALLIIPALFVVLVGPSRIYLGDHWASDVLGAYLVGGVWLGLWLSLYLKLKERGVLARDKTE
jgi:membrane-associated phospholipid phosphatase